MIYAHDAIIILLLIYIASYEKRCFQIEKREANQYSPLALAFLGDSVYEQLVREKLLMTANMPAHKLHEASVKKVRAGYQSRAAELISDMLDDDEADILRRGRNAVGGVNHVPKSSNHAEYGRATGLEALFGWLHLQGKRDRINELFEYIWERNVV